MFEGLEAKRNQDRRQRDRAMMASDFARLKGDRYFTEPWVTKALLDRVKFRGVVWEPACGRGDMVEVLESNGYEVMCCDIVGSDLGCEFAAKADFLTHGLPGDGMFSIVTNPPYRLAEEFIRKALSLTSYAGGMVAMLLRNEYDCAASRRGLFERDSFAAKFILTKRPRWRDDQHIASPRHNFAWFLWDHHHVGPARLEWLPGKVIEVKSDFDAHDDAMEPLGSHNWEPGQ